MRQRKWAWLPAFCSLLGCSTRSNETTSEKAAALTLLASIGDCLDDTCCPSGMAKIPGTEKADKLSGEKTPACLVGWQGDDVLAAGPAGDFLVGGAGVDRLSGGAGSDRIVGGPEGDLINGLAGNDELEGGSGDDKIEGDLGADRIGGGPGNDALSGGDGNDRMEGNSGDDLMSGGAGDDLLTGGAGKDQLLGDLGNDTFSIRGACELVAGETINGGPGADTVVSPLSQAEMVAMGVTFVSIETFLLKEGVNSHGGCAAAPDGTMVCECCNPNWADATCNRCTATSYSSLLAGNDRCLFGPAALTLRQSAVGPLPPVADESQARRVAETLVWSGAQANFVAVGRVTSVNAMNTPTGIRTVVQMNVSQVLKGIALGQIEFRFPGGEVAGTWDHRSERSRVVKPGRKWLVNLWIERDPVTERYIGRPVDGDSLFPMDQYDTSVGNGSLRVPIAALQAALQAF